MKIIRKSVVLLLIAVLLDGPVCACASGESVTINFSLTTTEEADLRAFLRKSCPGCRLKTNPNVYGDAIADMVLTRGDDVDVLMMASKTGLLQSLIRKGFYLDLSGIPAVRERVDALYPCLQSLVSAERRIAAYPLRLSMGPVMYWEPDLAEEMGLADRMPKSMPDVIALMRDYPEVELNGRTYTMLYDGSSNPLLRPFVMQYDLSMLSQQSRLTYDTPFFRDSIAALLQVNREVDAERGGWCLMSFVPEQSGRSLLAFNHRSTATHHVIPAQPGDDPTIGVDAQCLVINPFTKNPRAAEAVVSWLVTHQDAVDFLSMSPGAQQPLVNPEYEKQMANINVWIRKTRARIASPDTSLNDRAALELQLADMLTEKGRIEQEGAFLVSPAQLQWYQQQIVPHFFMRGGTAYESETWCRNQNGLFFQVLGGAIGLQEFVAQMEQRARLIALESGGQ